MEKSGSTTNRSMILGAGIMVALYVTLQFSIYLYKPTTALSTNVETQQLQLPNEATLFNAAMTYVISIIGVQKK